MCHLGKFYPPATGGIETHLQTLAQAQAQLGAQVHVLCVNHQNPQGDDVTFQTLATTKTVVDWDGQVKVTRVGRQASLARYDLCWKLLPVFENLSEDPPDILHLHVPNPTMLLALALVPLPCPLVITHHTDVIRQKLLSRCIRPFEHTVYRKAGAVIASSPLYPLGSELIQAYRRKVHIVPFGMDLDPFLDPEPAGLSHAQRFRQEHGQPLWLAVGRLVYYKGLNNAIHALTQVPGKLLVVGEGPLKSAWQQLAKELGVADRVVWLGRTSQEQLIGAYHAATALWFPSNSRSEAFGLVQIEAMASRCPVINTAIPGSGVSWVSRHEESGLTVPMDDPAALAQAAHRLLSEPGLRDKLSENARSRACQEYEQTLMAERSLAVYRMLLTKNLPSSSMPSSRNPALVA